MANIFSSQILADTTERVTIKMTGQFDGSGQEANSARIVANSFYGALDANNVPLRTALSVSNTALSFYDLQMIRMVFNVNFGQSGFVQLYWTGTNNSVANNGVIANISFSGEYGELQAQPPFKNNAIGGVGDIGIQTFGAAANTSYTIVMELRKNNQMYQRGQFNDPAAFNYGSYSTRP
jgi:hypothetical protein